MSLPGDLDPLPWNRGSRANSTVAPLTAACEYNVSFDSRRLVFRVELVSKMFRPKNHLD